MGPLERRAMLRMIAAGGMGLTLDGWLREAHGATAKAKCAIVVRLSGAPSHIDSFDPKPDAPVEIRGPFGVVKTKTGEVLGEHLPLLAACSDKFALVRSVTHNLGEHALASVLATTGNRPDPSLTHPTFGAVAARELAAARALPAAVGIPSGDVAGYLGVGNAPFSTGGDAANAGFAVAGLGKTGSTADRLTRRRELAELFSGGASRGSTVAAAIDRFRDEALAMVTSPSTRLAFDLRREPDAAREAYGRNALGQSLLLARRLVEAGVRFVTVTASRAWDLHESSFEPLKERLLPQLDQGIAALLADLGASGRLDETIVFATGEFGRTPKVNAKGGRDHWPNVYSALIAGGGVKGGVIVGSSDKDGGAPRDRPVSPQDLAATLYAQLGVDAAKRTTAPSGRVVPLLASGTPIRELT